MNGTYVSFLLGPQVDPPPFLLVMVASAAAGMFCGTASSYHYTAHRYNPYDYRTTEPYFQAHLNRFYNNASVQYQLGVVSDPTTRSPVKWEPDDAEINMAFQMSADFFRRTDFLLERLLRNGLDVLIYEGMVDCQ